MNLVNAVYKWYLPTLSEILALDDMVQASGLEFSAQQRVRAEREWSGAIAALNQLLQQLVASEGEVVADGNLGPTAESVHGIVLSGPVPVLDQPKLLDKIATWTFTVSTTGEIPLQLKPATKKKNVDTAIPTLPLLREDPLAAEQFCLALTNEFSLAMVLGETTEGHPAFLFSFEPEVIWQVWRSLQARLMLTFPQILTTLDNLIQQFEPVAPSYRTVTQFHRLMLAHLPGLWDLEDKRTITLNAPLPAKSAAPPDPLTSIEHSPDAELLQAIAHEVRTPLTTIRTLTRLLLKRKDLNPDVIKRLEIIDKECNKQIDRFGLFFRAVELGTAKTQKPLSPLAPLSLAQVFQQNLERWQQQASQRGHTLEIILPQKLPMVVTDPTMLDQALTGLIDRITQSLPVGSSIQAHVSLAGHQLKLQFEAKPQREEEKDNNLTQFGFAPALKSIGQLLMFQPETGNLSLSLPVTKTVFQALGGKLIVRQHPKQGEVLTVFLPLENPGLTH